MRCAKIPFFPVIAVLAAIGLVVSACGEDSLPTHAPVLTGPVNLLFIGNSLTYTNDLPGLLVAFAESTGVGPVAVRDVSVGGYGLQDHWVTSRTRDAIRGGGWDLVILQQGPSATEGRPSLLDYSDRFAGEARAVGAEVALYMVWPSLDRFLFFDDVLDSYRMASEQVEGLFLPAGEAWRLAWKTDSTLPFYGPDNFHPSRLGTYLAALVLFQQITGRSPLGLPAKVRTAGNVLYDLDPATAFDLQLAAAEANRRLARTVPGWPPAE